MNLIVRYNVFGICISDHTYTTLPNSAAKLAMENLNVGCKHSDFEIATTSELPRLTLKVIVS